MGSQTRAGRLRLRARSSARRRDVFSSLPCCAPSRLPMLISALINSNCGRSLGALHWQPAPADLWLATAVVGGVSTWAGPDDVISGSGSASKQGQPLSKARPELRSPAQFLLLPLDGVRRCPSFSTPVASLHERWCVFLPCYDSWVVLLPVQFNIKMVVWQNASQLGAPITNFIDEFKKKKLENPFLLSWTG